MPYIITIDAPENQDDALSRIAVATLEEAREVAYGVLAANDTDPAPHFDAHFAADNMDESGGTIGPLPDGTVIEVEYVHRRKLRAMTERPHATGTDAEIIDAYNARA